MSKDSNFFEPQDTVDTMYHLTDRYGSGTTLSEILGLAQSKWPGITPDQIIITSEYIHTRCVSYDLYDPGDWDNFLKIECSSTYLEEQTAPAKAA